jgi:uncharacterized membrane protein YqjE
MRRRLYFLLPNVESARQTADDLLLARIEDRHMHFLAKRGTALGELHEANSLQKSDLVHGAETGLAVGGICGLLAGVIAVLWPPGGVTLQLVTILIMAVIGAVLGAWTSSIIGAGVPNSRLKAFEHEIEQGRILLMVDVPPGRIEEIRELVARRHPEAVARGMESTVPAFP